MKPVKHRLEASWLIPLALALVAVFLFWLSLAERSREAANTRNRQRLEQVTKALISLHADLLESRLYYLNHFDSIVQNQKQLVEASAILRAGGERLAAEHAELEANFARLRELILQQDGVIEDFKTSLSVYKNSDQYVGVIVQEFLNHKSRTIQSDFLVIFSAFCNQLSSFRSKPNKSIVPELERRILELKTMEARFLLGEQPELQQVLDHSQVILTAARSIDASLAQILSGQIDQLANVIHDKLDEQQLSIRTSLKRYEQALYSIIVVLTLYTFFILIRLKLANDLLEQRVQERTRELGIASQKAIEADTAKSKFLAHMSHEIRTPLNGVIGMTALLQKKTLPPDIVAMIGDISSCGKSLLNLVNDILDFSKIEAEKLRLDHAPFDFREVLDESLAIVQMNALKENVRLAKDVSSELPPLIYGDRDRMAQVILNLLSNAIKFSKNGHVQVKLEIERLAEQRCMLTLHVIDNGIGIEAQHLQNLFQEFSQAHASVHARFGGTGLGLAIAKKLIEMMGGRILVQSEYGVGSTFTMVVPVSIAPELSRPTIEEPSKLLLALQYPHSILVIDDNFINRKVAVELLEALGYKAEVAKDGVDALELLRQREYDLVFTDLRMPGMDGYELVEKARALVPTSLRWVAMTASATVEERQRCQALGISEFVSKPVKEEDFVQILSREQAR